MREIECTRWFIGRRMILCVQVGWLVDVRVRLIRLTSMHDIKSIRVFEDVT